KNPMKSSHYCSPLFPEQSQVTAPASTWASPWIYRTDAANHASTPSRLGPVATHCASQSSVSAGSTAIRMVECPAGSMQTLPPALSWMFHNQQATSFSTSQTHRWYWYQLVLVSPRWL